MKMTGLLVTNLFLCKTEGGWWTVVVPQALRIDRKVQGQGIGRLFMKKCREFLLELNKQVTTGNFNQSEL